MATNLNFTTRGGRKEFCEITPAAPVVVQVIREDNDFFTVYANVEGMVPTTIFADNTHKDFIFQIDVPEGVTVTMESCSHVVNAKILQ